MADLSFSPEVPVFEPEASPASLSTAAAAVTASSSTLSHSLRKATDAFSLPLREEDRITTVRARDSLEETEALPLLRGERRSGVEVEACGVGGKVESMASTVRARFSSRKARRSA